MKIFHRFWLLLFASLAAMGQGVAPGLAQASSAAEPDKAPQTP